MYWISGPWYWIRYWIRTFGQVPCARTKGTGSWRTWNSRSFESQILQGFGPSLLWHVASFFFFTSSADYLCPNVCQSINQCHCRASPDYSLWTILVSMYPSQKLKSIQVGTLFMKLSVIDSQLQTIRNVATSVDFSSTRKVFFPKNSNKTKETLWWMKHSTRSKWMNYIAPIASLLTRRI